LTGSDTVAGAGNLRRVLANSGWLLAANGVTGVAGLTQAVILTRDLGVRLYGVLTVVLTVVLVTNRLTSFRMNEFVVKYVSDAMAGAGPRAAAAAVKFSMLIEIAASLLAFGVVMAVAPLASNLFVRETDAAHLIRLAGLMVLAMLVTETSNGVLQAFDQFRRQSVVTAVGALLSLAAVGIASALGGGLDAIVLALVAATLCSSVILVISVLRTVRRECGPSWWRVQLGALSGRLRQAFGFAASANASATLSLVARDADPLWLGFFRGPTEVAYYRLGFQLATYVVLPVTQLAQAFYPEIARQAARHDWEEFRQLLRRGTAVAAAYLVPAIAVTMLLAAPVVRALNGPAFAPAAVVLTVLLVGMGFANLFFWSRPALLAMGRPDYPVKVNIGVAGLKLAGVFIVIPLYGHIGNAALLAALYLFGVSLSVRKVWSEVRHRAAEAA
jgi:O-antigen/teichoic acid export membrane protein